MREYETTARAQAQIEESERPFVMFDIDEWALSPAARAWSYSLAIGAGSAIAALAYVYNIPVLYVPGAALTSGGVGGFVMLAVRLATYGTGTMRSRNERHYTPEPEPAGASTVAVDLGNGLGAVAVWEPQRGAFRAWLRQVVSDSRVQLSWRQARDRGWNEDRYHALVAQLREIGLLSNQMYNGAPECTEHGKQLARRWLGMENE